MPSAPPQPLRPTPTPTPSPSRSADVAQRPEPVSPRIDDPMALLLACHDKVRRFADLLLRLQQHAAVHGRDAQARDAAWSVLRYFEVAAPLHHADEDEDLYPALLALGDAGASARIQVLSEEHAVLTALWQQLAPWLRHLAAEGDQDGGVDVGAASDRAAADAGTTASDTARDFAARYLAHAEAEEREVYPLAARLSADTLARIAQAMVARRTAS